MATVSVPSPLPGARKTTMYCYSLPVNFPTVSSIIGNPDINESAMHPIARTVCRISLLYLCRITEVLSLTVSNVFAPDRVVCPGSKRGRAYMMYFPGVSQALIDNKVTDKDTLLFPITYHKCYMSYLKAGVRYLKPGSQNTSRTHSGRYAVRNLVDKFDNLSILSDLLHHKSSKSLFYYINK